MTSTLHGGKTAPRFLQDFNIYNPHKLPQSSYNVLTELALQYDGSVPKRATGKGSCRHKWSLKSQQTSPPELEIRPDSSSIYTVAAYCTFCCYHAEIQIDYINEGPGVVPCPTNEAPLHHFTYMTQASNGRQTFEVEDGSDSWVDIQHFQCSSFSCSARCTTFFRPPRLKSDWVALLVDKSLIRQRALKVMDDDPGRFEGHAIPSPIVVLANLRAYVVNAMSSPERRRIVGNNKKWLLSLGEPCADLLRYLGFTREEDDWMPPHPELDEIIPYKNSINKLLDDVEKELLVLIEHQPEEEKRTSKITLNSSPAMPEFERVLSSKDYKKSLASQTIDLTEDEHPFYAGLGATGDFHDNLIIFAYERQISCDPPNIPYYLECLQEIAEGRKSEELQTKAAIEASSGKISLVDVRKAYKSFGYGREADYRCLDDDTIIGTFQAQVTDAPKQEPELRRALQIIGQNRSSSRIEQIAANSVTTYEQALAWLGATEDLDDAFIISMYSIKVNENPLCEETARNAVAIIGKMRKSPFLLTWRDTGKLIESDMDVDQAYARLGIDDRTLDDETILMTYNFRIDEAPSQFDDLAKAITAITKSRPSKLLLDALNIQKSDCKIAEWPVGLENIGNTCYLNSLLQFYFTVKPLRELVLNFDAHKMSVDPHALRKKQVGSRRVSTKEVERAQNFVYELQTLFQNMITSPTDKVAPEHELARLTLTSSTGEDSIRRQSILSAHQPSLGETNGSPIQGPLPPPSSLAINTDTEMLDGVVEDGMISRAVVAGQEEDVSSEGTLVETPMPDTSEDQDIMILESMGKQRQEISDDKENLPPSKSGLGQEPVSKPISESPTWAADRQHRKQEFAEGPKETSMEDKVVLDPVRPPSRPPPIPPRQKPEEQKRAILQEVETGAQQDVTEVIANVLFQLQCAIKAETIDESGEQIDQVKRLFFGKQKSYTTNEQGVVRTKEEFFSDIKIDVASGPRDIYAALDGAFEVQEVEVGGSLEPQYTTLSQIPPILQVLVQRAQFDLEKKTTFKSNHHLELKETIYMDRYMDVHDINLQKRREEFWIWKKDLATLEARKKYLCKTGIDVDMPETLSKTVQYLRQVAKADPDVAIEVSKLLAGLEIVSDDAKNEVSAIDRKMKLLSDCIATQFSDLRTLPYRLHSVFIHRGGVNSGHYWIYIFDFTRNIWRNYNDGYVTEVKNLDEIYMQEPGPRPATPYFLVYVKDDLKDRLVDAVCRDVSDDCKKENIGTDDNKRS